MIRIKTPASYLLSDLRPDTHDTATIRVALPADATPDMFRAHLPPSGPDTVPFLCGPPPMVDALEETLKALGYPEQAIILPRTLILSCITDVASPY